MISTQSHIEASLEILLGELMTDDDLRDSFMRDPARTLRCACDWALPLTDSELQSLRAMADRLWERLAWQLEMRMHAN
jgi:hypothetical protein